MNAKCLCFVTALAVAIGCLVAPVQAEIKGNTSPVYTPSTYTVVSLPDNYASDPASQALLRGMATDPTLIKLRQSTQVQTYSASNPDFKYRFSKRLPEVAAGKPVFMVIDGTQMLYGAAGKSVKDMSREMCGCGIFDKIRERRNHNPQVKTEVVAQTTPIMPLLPPIEEEKEPEVTKVPVKPSNIVGLILIGLLGAVGGVIAYSRVE